jgi:hypothetical protein
MRRFFQETRPEGLLPANTGSRRQRYSRVRMPRTTISGRMRLARVVIPIGPIEKTKKDVAKASSNPCAAPPTDEGPLIRFRIPVSELEKMLARKRRATRSARSPKESSTMIDFNLTPHAAVRWHLPLIRVELPLKTNSGKK